jgi:cytidine deaminase
MQQAQWDDMLSQAKKAAAKAHCPYSQFQVGASLLADDGKIYTGFNLENSAFPSSICAECCALCNAVANGATSIKAAIVYTPTDQFCYPCGNCRQTLSEFAGDIPIQIHCDKAEHESTSLAILLPANFSAENFETVGSGDNA